MYRILECVVGFSVPRRWMPGAHERGGRGRAGQEPNGELLMTRCILVGEIVGAGYSVITAAQLLGHTPQAIRHLLEFGYRYHRLPRAYRIGEVWAVLLCMKIEPGGRGVCLVLV